MIPYRILVFWNIYYKKLFEILYIQIQTQVRSCPLLQISNFSKLDTKFKMNNCPAQLGVIEVEISHKFFELNQIMVKQDSRNYGYFVRL